MFNQHEQHVSHVVVAHTLHRPYVASTNVGRFKHVRADQYIKTKMEQTRKDTRYALNCFYKLLYTLLQFLVQQDLRLSEFS